MRMAPVGLFASRLGSSLSLQETFELGAELGALTHGHPTGALAAGALAVLILALTEGDPLYDALHVTRTILNSQPNAEETLQSMVQAESLAATDLPPHEAIAQLGQGWVAEEALAIAIYCALVARTFRQGVILAVNHDGDSDSTGSITGNLLGAMYGVRAIPKTWLATLELRNVIREMAEDLYAFSEWPIGEYSSNIEVNEQIWAKYPGG